MFQPFEEFRPNHLKLLEQLKKKYLVSQSYPRGNDPLADEQKTAILLTDYEDLGKANLHLNAIRNNPLAAILSLENEKHVNKLNELMAEGSQYRLYWNVVKSKNEVKERIERRYNDNIRRYINLKTNWRIGGDKTIHPDIQVEFGELFIILKYGGYQDIRVKFEEIEKA